MSEPVIYMSGEQVRRIFALLMDHVTRNSGGDLVISKDYFWSIPAEARYDVYNEPTEFTIGQVSESWDNLRGIAEDESKAVGYALVWLADVLRAIGDESLG